MSAFSEFWTGLGARGRTGFVVGVVGIVVIVAALATWTLRPTYGVLFSGLSEPDLAAMAGELDKMKVPYRVSDDGAQLLVEEAQVRKTRLALMGRELPLHGTVGFELFNNVEFGTSEFVQKINYQRALQGELTRTILAIDEVQSARVHLALPEQGLFRQEAQKPKASVSIATKPGRSLRPQQVQGIQRLVAASVPEVQAQDVTVLDQHGVPLSRAAVADDSEAMGTTALTALDAKAELEKYLTKKATEVLDRSFGAGVAVVSVDASFTQEQSRVTTEEVLPARAGDAENPPTGVVARERQTMRGAEDGSDQDGPQITSTETEYQLGKRTEQISAPAGRLKRLNVAVVLRRALSEADQRRVRDVVSATIGIDRDRGDAIAVEVLAAGEPVSKAGGDAMRIDSATVSTDALAPSAAASSVAGPVPRSTPGQVVLLALAALAAVVALAMIAWLLGRRRAPPPQRPLSDEERERLLHTVKDWLVSGKPPAAS